MKQEIIKRILQTSNTTNRFHLLREELQHLILQELDRKGAFNDMCFLGGTALRILFGLDRFSEDLDFSTSQTLKIKFHLKPLAESISHNMAYFGFENSLTKVKTEKNVQSLFITFFPFKEIKIGINPNQKLAIKLEIDTNPPLGAKEILSPVRGPRLYKVKHYSLPSLFSGKLHALLYRHYTKGRDLYDYLWYASQNIPVNKTLLENAIHQSQNKIIHFSTDQLRKALLNRFESIDFKKAAQDVSPFIKDAHSLTLFDKVIFENTLEKICFE